MIRYAVPILALTVLLMGCSGGDGDETPTASPSVGPTTPAASGGPTGGTDVFLLYRDAAGDLVAQDFAGGDTFRQTVDFNNEVIVGATCTPDGSRIAFLKQNFTETDRRVEIHGEDAPANHLTIPATVQGVAWSPDGTQIAITDYDGFAQEHEVSVLDTESGEITNLEAGPDFAGSIAWSPDGSRLAFYVQTIDGGDTSIVTLSPDGSGRQEFADPDLDWFDPDWSADGRSILVAGLSDLRFQLYQLDSETGEHTQITDSEIFKRGPKYSPDGTTIGYTGSIVEPQVSLRPALTGLHSFGIFVLGADGTGERAFTADPRLNPGAAVDPYLDAYMLGWCAPGPWLDDSWVAETPAPTQ